MENNELLDRVEKLEEMFQDLMDTVKKSEDDYNYSKNLEGFKGRNSDKLSKYEAKLKKLNGDDFDIYKAAMDEYDSAFSDFDESVYVDNLIGEIEKRLQTLREAVEEEKPEEEVEEEKPEESTEEDSTEEDEVKEEPEAEITVVTGEDASDELDDFYKDLENSLDKFKK